MNKILKLKFTVIPRLKLNKQVVCYINTETNKKNELDFNIQSLGIKSKLKKFVKYESFVYRSFFGEFDADYLKYVFLDFIYLII